MTSLLGANDEIVRTLEALIPAVDIHVRGNEITLHGPAADVGLVDQLFAELLVVLRTGQGLTVDAVERSFHMLRGGEQVSPAEVLSANIQIGRAHV